MIKLPEKLIKELEESIAKQIYEMMPKEIKEHQIDLLDVQDLDIGFKVVFNASYRLEIE